MTDYLTRLAERTLGTLPTARPDLSAFAPMAAAADAGDRFESVEQSLEIAVGPNPAEPLPEHGPAVGGDAASAHPYGPQTADGARLPPQHADDAGAHTPPHPRSRVPGHDHLPVAPEPRARHGGLRDRVTRPQPLNRPSVHPGAAADLMDARADGPARSPGDVASGPPGAPAITIRIGRIDVHSASTDVPKPTTPPSKRDHLRSLDTYLCERNGGRT